MKKNSLLQKLVLLLSLIIYLTILGNQYFSWNLLGMNPLTLSMLGIFISSLLLWLFIAIDWPSLLCLLGMALIPEVGFTKILPLSFGNITFAFLLFTFLLTYSLEQTYFIKRVTAWALHSRWAQASSWKLLIAFYCVMLCLGSFISPTILFMIAYPIFEELAHQFGFDKGNRNAAIMLFTLYTTIAIGTAMTPINHVFAITAIGLYEAAFKASISYFQYMMIGIPTGIFIFIFLLIFIKYVWKLELAEVTSQRLESLKSIPKMSREEKWIVTVFAMVVAMWLLPELFVMILPGLSAFFKQAGIVFPPLMGVIMLAVIRISGKPLLDINKAMKEGVYWPSLLLVAATLALGSMLANENVGIVALLNNGISPIFNNLSGFVVVLIFVIWAGLQTNLSSNLVTVSVVSAVAIALANSLDFSANSALIAVFIGFMSSMAMMTPPAMPYVAIAIGERWLTSRQALIFGFWILVVTILSCMLVGYPIGSEIL